MSNNDELLNRFREMMEKKKLEEKSKSQESFYSSKNSNFLLEFDDDKNNLKLNEGDKNSNKKECEEKSTFMDKLRKIRSEVFEDVKETSTIKNDKILKCEKAFEENENNSEINSRNPRPSVFDLAKRFEKKEKKSIALNSHKIEKPELKINTSDINRNNIEERENPELTKTSTNTENLNKNFENCLEENILLTDDNLISQEDEELRRQERTSNSKQMMLNSLQKIKEEERNKSVLNITNNSDIILESDKEFKEHIITDIPKRLVKDLIKMNEKRLRSNSEKGILKQRNTVSQRMQINMSEIRSFIESLKANNKDEDDLSELLKKNQDKFKRFGIDSKDAHIVQELIDFFENSSTKKERNSVSSYNKNRKHRNTVSNMGRANKIIIDIDTIKEEKDEETSLINSFRISESQRLSLDQENKKEFNNKNKLHQDMSLNNSVDSEECFEGLKVADVEIAGDEDIIENQNKACIDCNNKISDECDSQNKQIAEQNRYSNIFNENSAKDEVFNFMNVINLDNTADKNKSITPEPIRVVNITYESTSKKFKNLCISEPNYTDVQIKSEKPDYRKINELSFYYEEKSRSSNNNPEYFRLHKQSPILIKSIPRTFNLKLSKEYSTSFINSKSETNTMSIENASNHNINAQINHSKQIFLNSESTGENVTSLMNSQTIDYENNKELINVDNYTIHKVKNKTNDMISCEIPNSSVKLIEDYQQNKTNSNKYHKNIINSIDSISILQYKLDSKIIFDPTFFDVLCTNCYECVKYEDIDLHSDKCVLQVEENFKDLYEMKDADEDYNSKIYKLYESLKNRNEEIYCTRSNDLIAIYEEFSKLTYEILINNNSIEELDKSITKLNDLLNSKLCKIRSKYYFSLLVFGQRISQLVYIKLQDMENILLCVRANVDLEEIGNGVNKDGNYNNEDIYTEEEIDAENIKEIEMLKKELVNLEKQTLDTRLEIEEWRNESKKLENNLRRPIQNSEVLSDIVSDVLSRRDESFDEMTMISEQTSEYDPHDVGNMKDFSEFLDVNNEEDMKKYFLSIGLNLKFKYGDRIKGNASISDLYEKAKQANVPITHWYNFIYDGLDIN